MLVIKTFLTLSMKRDGVKTSWEVAFVLRKAHTEGLLNFGWSSLTGGCLDR